MSTGADFKLRITLRATEMEKSVEKVVRKTALTIDQLLVKATPVDTGQAKSNWLVSLDHPRRETISPYSPGKAGRTKRANESAAIQQGKAAVANYKSGVNSEIWIANNLPYIGLLNTGTHSTQADPNFVQTAVLSGVQYIKSQKGKVFR